MKTRQLGKNGPNITEIGFGAWAIGGPWSFGWGPSDDREAIDAISYSLEHGINWIDTAAVYGLGHSEELVGRAVKGKRDKVFVATKCGLPWDEQRRVQGDISPASIRRECEGSLRRLGTDHLDLYQIHWPDGKTPETEAWQTMAQLQKEGKVRYIGVSNFDVPMLEACQKIAPIQSLQPPYSMLIREIEAQILPFCEKNGIGVVAYSPMQTGLLSGKFNIAKLAKDDWRLNSPMFAEPFLSKVMSFVDELRPIAAKYDKTVGQLAIGWVLVHSAVTSAIVGARRPEQVRENVGGSGFSIDSADMNAIEHLFRKHFGAIENVPSPY